MNLGELVNKYRMILNIAVIILALIIANSIYKNQAKTINSLKAGKDTEIKKNAVLNDISALQKKLNSYKNTFNKKDVSLAINTIGDIAKNSGIKIVSIKPEIEKDYSAYIQYPFSLFIDADNYHAIGKFIHNLESHTDAYIVENLKIKPAPQIKEEAQALKIKLNADLRLSTVKVKD